MNRIYFSLVVLFLLSCSEIESLDSADNISPDSPLNINALTQLATKGELVNEPQDMGSIGLYCEMTGNEEWSSSTTFSKMVDRRYSISSDDEWVIDGDPEPWGYESLNDRYTFFAYSPHCGDTQGVTPKIVGGELIIDYIVPNSSISQPDLMYAVPRKDIYAPTEGTDLSLNFCHTLSSVSFALMSSSDERITAIDITGIISEGSLGWDYEFEAPQWGSLKQTDAIFSVEVENYTPDDKNAIQLNTERGYLMMIPQVLTDGAEVTLTIDGSKTMSLTIPAGTEWEAGLKYEYTIMIDYEESDFIFDSTEISNCYIINPTPGQATFIQIPIEDRINDFWKNYSGKGSNMIKAANTTSQYTIEIVWEDFDDKLTLTIDEDYKIVDDDNDKMAVQMTIPANFQEGNLVFSVEMDDGDNGTDRLWSWHLWFTDYNPDIIAAANQKNIVVGEDKAYTFGSYEGAVHRYKDGAGSTVWSDIYKDKFIMDRNIGERNEPTTNYGAGSVYFQFGRKDPFPGNKAKYSGKYDEPSARTSSGFSYIQSVVLSYDFFITSTTGSSRNWCAETEARSDDYIWFDPFIAVEYYSVGKSIFDPSPFGWRVPVNGTWSSFNETGSTQAGAETTKSVGIYTNYGCRSPEKSSALDQGGDMSYVWSATPYDTETGYCLSHSYSSVLAPAMLIMTYGLPVRAIQE